MAEQEAVTNRDGNVWLVEHSESAHLTHVGGFLMTFHDLSCIVISARLADADKARGRDALRSHLTQTAVGTSGTILWHPDDDSDQGKG
jgi:hypothetical protein